MDGSMACASANNADDVVVDHNTPVSPSIGISKPGPVVPTPPSYYGTNSSKYNTFIVGADGQVYSKAYSYRPIVRNTLRRLRKIGSHTLDEFDKKIIVNSVSSSNVTSHEAEAIYVKVKTNNEITRTITPDYKTPTYTIEPDNNPELRLPSIPHTLRREDINFDNLFQVDKSSTNPTTPQGTASSAILPTTATKRRLVTPPDVSSSDGGQLSDSPNTPQEDKKEKPYPIPTAIRQRPRAFILDIGIDQVVPMDEITFGIFPNLPRNPQHYQQPADDVPLHFAAHYLLGKNDTLPDNSSQRLNLLYHLVFMRARFTIPPDNMFIRIEEVPGWETCRQKLYADFPRNSDGVIQLWRKWQLENPFMVKLREMILDVGEHGKEEVLTLLKDAELLDEVWEKTHDYDWYVKKILATHKEGKTCYPGCQFCKGTLFTGAIHNDEDHKSLKAQQQKATVCFPSGRMVQPSSLNEQQHAEQAWGIKPTCAARHEHDTHSKMRNGKGDYGFRNRLQYAFLVVLVLHVNGYTCKHTGVEITWDTYTAYDAEHPAMGMNVMIDGEEFPTRKIIGIADVWHKSWKSFAEFFDVACREVTVTYVVNTMAHALIGWGHHEKRCNLLPALPPFPFEKVELVGRTVLKPLALPPTNSTTTTSVETVTNVSTTITSSTINVTTATTTKKSTNLKSIEKPVLDTKESEALVSERIRIKGMKKIKESSRKRKSEEVNEKETIDQGIADASQEHVATVNVTSIAISDDGVKTATAEDSTPRTGSFALFLNQLVFYASAPCKIVGFSGDRSKVTVLGKDGRVEVDADLVEPVSCQTNIAGSIFFNRVMLHSDSTDTKKPSCIPKLDSLTNDEREQLKQAKEEAHQEALVKKVAEKKAKAKARTRQDAERKAKVALARQQAKEAEAKARQEEADFLEYYGMSREEANQKSPQQWARITENAKTRQKEKAEAEAQWQIVLAKRKHEERLDQERIAKIEERLEQERIAKMAAAQQHQAKMAVARQQAMQVARLQAQQQAQRQQQAQQQQQARRKKLRKDTDITRAQFNASLKEGKTVKYCFSPVQIVGFNADRTFVTIRGATGRTVEVNINQITPNDVNL